MIEVRDLRFSYRDTEILRGVDLDVLAGEVLALVGPSGSGKTTLLYCLAGVLRGWDGTITIDGRHLAAMDERELSDLRAQRFGYVLQFGRLVPELTALENVTLPLRILRVPRREALQRGLSIMEDLGIAHLAKAHSGRLSGGEQQRTAVARALVHRPAVIFADEPTGALDSVNADLVMGCLLAQAREQQTSVVVVTHDEDVAARADRVLAMKDGKLRHATRA